MRILIDFDNVIFDTGRTVRETLALLKKYGVSKKRWIDSWKEIHTRKYFGKGLYSIWDHADKYLKNHKFDKEKFLADYFKLHDANQYVYRDAADFLNFAKKNAESILVTFGHKKFQAWKIFLSKIEKYFQKIEIVQVMKARRVGDFIKKNDINVFVDDHPMEVAEVKIKHPEVLVLHLRRPGAWHGGRTKHRDFEVTDLRQAVKLLKKVRESFVYDVGTTARALARGEAVAYPTDTAYGLGVDAANPVAIRKLIKIKNRPGQPIHILVSSIAMARKYATFDEAAEKLCRKFVPGPITFVLPTLPPLNPPDTLRESKRAGLPLPSERGRKGRSFLPHDKGERQEGVDYIKLLSAGTGTIGIRMPDNKIALELVRRLGRPITTPSANPHGGDVPYSAIDAFKQFYGKKHQPDLYLNAGILPKRQPSTIVLVKNGKIKILRKGPITKKQIIQSLRA